MSLYRGCLQRKRRRWNAKSGLVAESAQTAYPTAAFESIESHGGELRICGRVQKARSRGGKKRHFRAHGRLSGLVAGRLWALWSILYPNGMAQRRNVSNPG